MGQNQGAPALAYDVKSLVLQNKGLECLPYQISKDHPIETLDLSGNNIQRFPTHLDHLVFLDLSKNRIRELRFPSSFSYQNLQVLRLSNNELREFPEMIKDLPRLKQLDLDRNLITKRTVILMDLRNLAFIDLFLNHLQDLPLIPESCRVLNMGFNDVSRFAVYLPVMRELRLPGNEIIEMSTDCMMPSCEILDLSLNKLVYIPPILPMSLSLVELNLSYNFLSEAPQELPETLKKIDLSHNELKKWEGSLMGLVNLEYFDVSYNQLESLPEVPVSVTFLGCEHNKLKEMAPLKMQGMQTFQLSYNEFDDLPDFHESQIATFQMRFSGLKELTPERLSRATVRIDLLRNDLTMLSPRLFDIDRMQVLNIASNHIEKIPEEIVNTKITSLFISENPISELPRLPQTLLTIHASKCLFTEIPAAVFEVKHLKYVNFSCNKISAVPTLPNVNLLNLSHNEITEIPALPDALITLFISHNRLSKVALTGDLILVQELDISHNQISEFTSESELMVLHTLNASFNPISMKLERAKFPALRVVNIVETDIEPEFPLPDITKEFAVSRREYFDKGGNEKMRFYQSERCGFCELQGMRPSQEDSMIMRREILPGTDLYGLMDGHGGNDTSTIAANVIPKFYLDNWDSSGVAIGQVLEQTNNYLQKRNVKDGAVLVLVSITNGTVSCGHLGDSRAVMIRRDGTVNQLTIDHKPTDRSEVDLIKVKRSFVENGRVAGILSASRALGDFGIPGISSVPDIRTFDIQPDDYRLVLACDGVFDVMPSEELGPIITEVKDPAEAASVIANTALARGSSDNVSVIVVDLDMYRP